MKHFKSDHIITLIVHILVFHIECKGLTLNSKIITIIVFALLMVQQSKKFSIIKKEELKLQVQK